MSELRRRSITAIGIGAGTLGAILSGQYGFTIFILLLGFAANFEIYQMLIGNSSKSKAVIFSMVANVPLWLGYANHFEGIPQTNNSIILLLPILIVGIFIFLLKKGAEHNAKYLLALCLGLAYVSLCLLASIQIGWMDGNYAYVLPLGIVLLIWANDVFAYLIGSRFGKSAMAPNISPKKTWEGTLGGLICTVIASLLFYLVSGELSVYIWLGLGFCIAIFSTIGDLIESCIKRYAGVKDSGSIFPGHGGVFDRFDSFICVLPIVALYLFLFL